ncbi:MAG: NAD(P)H dehydrogenase [Comamonadaceae bacterium]|nr:MAG: NAD(P)H dehydrogenase [Comamonadaceae bacterium]
MTHLLHLDASARPGRAGEVPHGSQTRRLTHRFVSRWHRARPKDPVTYRDLGMAPPTPIGHAWVAAAFSEEERAQAWTHGALDESERLIADLKAADVLVIGSPLYNFGMPAALKAWVDQVVRIGLTFDVNPEGGDAPYRGLLADRPRTAVVLVSRGGTGYGPGEPLAGMNHLEGSLATALGFMGITDIRFAAVENEEAGDALFEASVAQALAAVDRFADELVAAQDANPG